MEDLLRERRRKLIFLFKLRTLKHLKKKSSVIKCYMIIYNIIIFMFYKNLKYKSKYKLFLQEKNQNINLVLIYTLTIAIARNYVCVRARTMHKMMCVLVK